MPAPLLLAACGLYCGACYHYRASFPGGEHLLAEEARGGRPLEGYRCEGCHAARRYVHPGCAACEIRACAESRGLADCAACPERPCARLRAFQSDGRPHHRDVLDHLDARRAVGPARWLEAQAQRWTCTCGARFSWYEVTCARCGAALASYGSGDSKDLTK